ncbi:hypothetical protein AAH048_12725 [Parabacteroides merdae]
MFGIDMPFTVGGYNAVHPVIGDHIGIDDESVGVGQFLPGAEFRFQ